MSPEWKATRAVTIIAAYYGFALYMTLSGRFAIGMCLILGPASVYVITAMWVAFRNEFSREDRT